MPAAKGSARTPLGPIVIFLGPVFDCFFGHEPSKWLRFIFRARNCQNGSTLSLYTAMLAHSDYRYIVQVALTKPRPAALPYTAIL